jgi:hypothetical protein
MDIRAQSSAHGQFIGFTFLKFKTQANGLR